MAQADRPVELAPDRKDWLCREEGARPRSPESLCRAGGERRLLECRVGDLEREDLVPPLCGEEYLSP
jgi:hypothetical protein